MARKKRCTKTTTYKTLAEARAAIAAMAAKYGGVVYKKPYRCSTHKGWHITSTPPRGGRRIKH
jgi:hypothetical protein